MPRANITVIPTRPPHTARDDASAGAPFQQSLDALALIAMREVGADGFALYTLDPARNLLNRISANGLPGRQPQDIPLERPPHARAGLTLLGDVAIFSIPLQGNGALLGVLELAFRGGAAVPAYKKGSLQRMASLIESILSAARRTARHVHLAARISRLEAGLADLKIADRARGLLRTGVQEGEVAEILAQHIDNVLSRGELDTKLETHLNQVEDRFEERRLTSKAKVLLEQRLGLTEEEAYHHIRGLSRKNRKRLKDVAKELIENWPLVDGPTPWGA